MPFAAAIPAIISAATAVAGMLMQQQAQAAQQQAMQQQMDLQIKMQTDQLQSQLMLTETEKQKADLTQQAQDRVDADRQRAIAASYLTSKQGEEEAPMLKTNLGAGMQL